jgi:hypothetical protein
MDKDDSKENFVEVSVVTTSGSFPSQGFERVPKHQKVKVVLEKTAAHLGIADTGGWIATVSGREIKIDTSFIDNGLSGQIEIDFGPREGGGGNASFGGQTKI